jgi:hypothetical protein
MGPNPAAEHSALRRRAKLPIPREFGICSRRRSARRHLSPVDGQAVEQWLSHPLAASSVASRSLNRRSSTLSRRRWAAPLPSPASARRATDARARMSIASPTIRSASLCARRRGSACPVAGLRRRTWTRKCRCILGKLGVQSRTPAALYAGRVGVVPINQLGATQAADERGSPDAGRGFTPNRR